MLTTSFHSKIDFLIHLLATNGEIEEPDVVSLSLLADSSKIKSHAIESLESSCDSTILNAILPIIDTRPLVHKIEHCRTSNYCDESLSLNDVILCLGKTPSLINKIMAIRFKAKYDVHNWKKDLIQQMVNSTEPFHTFAYELLDQHMDTV